MSVDEIVDEILEDLDQRGVSLASDEWLDLCRRVAAGAQERANAAADDLKRK